MTVLAGSRALSLAGALVASGLVVCCGEGDGATGAAPVRVAVASNFVGSLRDLAQRYENRTGRRVAVSSGSTGKLYAQIQSGAPFDLFFAADEERPRLLEEQGLCVPETRFTYALGRIVLWSAEPGLVDDRGRCLEGNRFGRLAIASPELAPYGRAALEVLKARGLWKRNSDKLVRGENVAQTFQFVHSGNAPLGFVALAQLRVAGAPAAGSRWEVPTSLHSPIRQQAVLLRDSAAARGFLAFVRSAEARSILVGNGYGVP